MQEKLIALLPEWLKIDKIINQLFNKKDYFC